MNTLSKTPRYQEMVEDFTARMKGGDLVPGARLPSFSELRDQFGVSQTTVVKFYAHLEREGLIRREPKRGIFVTEPERSLTGRIGFVGTAFARRSQVPYAAQLVDGIEAVAHRENLQILLLKKNEAVEAGTVDGVLATGLSATEIENFKRQGIPAVSLLVPQEDIPSVVADDYGGARMAIRKLLDLGHHRIAALMQNVESVQLRTAGYKSALSSAGIEIQEGWLRDPRLPITEAGYRTWGYEAMQSWLAKDWQELACTALFVQNDMAALGVLDALREANISVPRQLSVLSFDGTEVCQFCWPTLAAAAIPLEEIASTGMELLLRMIHGESLSPVTLQLPATWSPGESVAAPAAQ